MSTSTRKTFLVLYLVPSSVMDAWSKTDPVERKPAEEKMKGDWATWVSEHSKMIVRTEAAGRTKRVTSGEVCDTRNDVMLVSIVEAESHEAATQSFVGHPHLRIPQASIEIMEMRPMGAI